MTRSLNILVFPEFGALFSSSQNHRITESQSHRMAIVRRDLWGPSGPIPQSKQGHLEQAAQDRIQAGFECLQRRYSHLWPTFKGCR